MYTMYKFRASATRLLLSLLAITILQVNARAQEVRYKTISKTELHVLGFLGGLFDGETKQEVSIKGYKMRTDDKDQSTIMDLDNERIINIDHKRKEYSIMTFAELSEMMSSLGTRLKEGQGEAAAEAPAGEQPEVEFEFDLEIKDTGETKKIDGHKTKQKILILETRFKPKDASADTLPAGSFYAVTDMWLADEIAEMQPAKDFQARMAEIMQGQVESMDMAGVLNQLLDSYPQVGEAMERSKEEMVNVDGFPLQTTMHLVTVPADKDLDLELALGEKKEEKKGGGFGGFLKKMAQSQGLASGDDEEAEMKQKTIMSVFSTTEDISNKSRDASYFEPPSNYKEVEFQSPMEAMNEG